MIQDYIRINGLDYTHLLREEVFTSLNTTPNNMLISFSSMKSFLKKNELLREDPDDDEIYINFDKKILYKTCGFKIALLKFKTKLDWVKHRENYRFISLGQNLRLKVFSKNGYYDVILYTYYTGKNNGRIANFLDLRLDEANDAISNMMISCNIPKINF